MTIPTTRAGVIAFTLVLVAILFTCGVLTCDAGDTKKSCAEISIQSIDGQRLIRAEDIQQYDWPTHTILLRKGVRSELENTLRGKLVAGYGFRFVVNGESVYNGTITTSVSSRSFPTPVIVLDGRVAGATTLEKDQIRIELGYPSREFFRGKDPRKQKRIKAVLVALGKFAEQDE